MNCLIGLAAIAMTFVGFLATTGATQAQDFRQLYVGKDPCALGIKGDYDFSLRLDKTRNSELRDLVKGNASIVMITVYGQGGSTCGIIQDVVQIKIPNKHFDEPFKDKHFEFRCFDVQAPTDVAIGTIVRKYKDIRVIPAIEAWRIDLKEQKFVRTRHKVVCSADGWDGEDDGSDMVDEAKKYAAHGKPGQFGPGPNTK